jgi:hypothetical protein
MQKINRLLILGAAVVGMAVSAAAVSAQTREARGAVAAVTDSMMTVKTGAGDVMTFYIDGETHLEVRSSARDVQAAQPGRPSPRVNDFFEAGNPVLVRYRDENGRNHALSIERVGSPGGAKESSLAEGKVTSVSASHMTISSDGRDLTFAVTGDTNVLARGASKATKAAGKGTPLTTFVHSGDEVSVTYRKAAGALAASEIRVRVASR